MDIYIGEITNSHKSAPYEDHINAVADNCFRIIYVTDGEASYTVKEKQYTLPKGNYVILDHNAICDTSNSQIIQIIFKADFLDKSYTEISAAEQLYNEFISKSGYTVENKSIYHNFMSNSVYERIAFIASEAESKNFGYEKCIKGAVCEIIVMTIRNISVIEIADKTIELHIERITSEISKHYNENIQLSQFAEELGYSVSYLSECFKLYTGQTFSDYLKKIRMKAAHNLIIENPEKSIEHIARDVGYTDIKFFAATFKKVIGITPKEDIETMKIIKS